MSRVSKLSGGDILIITLLNMYSSFDPTKCSRVIHYSKYERNAPEIRSWWCKLFSMLETDASIVSCLR